MILVQKVSRLKVYLARKKWIINERLTVISIVSLTTNTFISASFLYAEKHLKLPYHVTHNNIILTCCEAEPSYF